MFWPVYNIYHLSLNYGYAIGINPLQSCPHLWPSIQRTGGPHLYRILYALEWRTVSVLTRGLFWCLFPELRSNEGNKYQNNTRVSTEAVRHESTYIILFLTRHNEFMNNDKNDDLFPLSPCLTRKVLGLLMTSQSIADDIAIIRQLWRYHVNSDI